MLYFSPVSVQKLLYHPRFIYLLFQYTTLYINHAQFLSCLRTQNCISATLKLRPVSVRTTATLHFPLFLYTTHYITYDLFQSFSSTQHCILLKDCFSPASKHNIVYNPRSFFPVSIHNNVHAPLFSLLFQYRTLHIALALFLSCFGTKHCITSTLYFSPVSVHNIVHHQRSISLLFQYTTTYITPRSISRLFQYTMFISHKLNVPRVSVHNTV